MARALDFSFSTGVLGVEWPVLSRCESSLGGGRANGVVADAAGGRNGSLYCRPVSESAEPVGLCMRVRGHARPQETISVGGAVVGVRPQRASADADVHD